MPTSWQSPVFTARPGVAGLVAHLRDEWVVLANLFGLLMGFALLSRHFETSHVPLRLPDYLPDDWRGGFVLLVMVFVLSSFLDNIAAALIGGTVAATVFRAGCTSVTSRRLVAASNAGGSGSVVGDTTTTMMWIDGVSPLDVLHAYVAAGVALVVCGLPASLQQQRYSPIAKARPRAPRRLGAASAIVALILVGRRSRSMSSTNVRLSRILRPLPVSRRHGLGRAARDRRLASSRLVRDARDAARHGVPAVRWCWRRR